MKMLLTSTGFTNKNLERIFLESMSKTIAEVKVLFVPTAANDEESRNIVPFCKQDLTDAGVLDENIVTYDCDRPINFEEIANYDAIYFCGGSSVHLMNEINKIGFAAPLMKAVENGLFFIGVSAGSMICSTAVENNLGVVPNPIKPHSKDDAIADGSMPAIGVPVNISDDQAVWIHDGIMEIVS